MSDSDSDFDPNDLFGTPSDDESKRSGTPSDDESPIPRYESDSELSPLTEEELIKIRRYQKDLFGTPEEGEDRILRKNMLKMLQDNELPSNVRSEIRKKMERDKRNIEIENRQKQYRLLDEKKRKEKLEQYLLNFEDDIRMVMYNFIQLDKDEQNHDSLKRIVSINENLEKWNQSFLEHYYLLFDFMIKYSEERERNLAQAFFNSYDIKNVPEDFINMVHFVAYEFLHPDLFLPTSYLQTIFRDWRSFEAKLKIRDIHFPPNVKGLTLPKPIQKEQPLPLLEIINPTQETIDNIKKEITEFVSQHTQESWKFLDHFLIHWFLFRREQYSGFPIDISIKQLELLFSWILDFDRLVLVRRKYMKLITQKPISLPQDEQKDVLFKNSLVSSMYYPKLPHKTILEEIKKYLILAKRPFRISQNGSKLFFSFDLVNSSNAIVLKQFMMNVIHGLADKMILEARLRKKLSEQELQEKFDRELKEVLSGGLDKVYDFIKDHPDIQYVIQLSMNRILKESKKEAINVKPSVVDKRSMRKRLVQHHIENQDVQDDEDVKCSSLCENVLVRLPSNELPDEKYVYYANPLADENGYLYYGPSPYLKRELCARETTLKPSEDGVWIEGGTFQIILARHNKGGVEEFTRLDYESFLPLYEISGSILFSDIRLRNNYLDEIYHRLNELVPIHFEYFYEKITMYNHLKLIQVLQFFYCMIVFRNPTFQLYHKDLIKLIEERVTPATLHTILRNHPDHDVLSAFFKVVFHLTHETAFGPYTGVHVLQYTYQFIFQSIQKSFPFLIMNPLFPVLPIFDFSTALLKLSSTPLLIESYPDPTIEVVVPKKLSLNFHGIKPRMKVCSCGSNEGVFQTIKFKEGIPVLVWICDQCRPSFVISE